MIEMEYQHWQIVDHKAGIWSITKTTGNVNVINGIRISRELYLRMKKYLNDEADRKEAQGIYVQR